MAWIYDEKTWFIKDDKGRILARVETYNVTSPEYDKNVRKLAAAPEMYELLKELAPLLAVHSYSESEAVKISQLLTSIDGEDKKEAKS